MTNLPPIPTKKKLFPSPDIYQQQKDYFRKIRDVLLALSKSLSKGRDKQITMSFLGYINPGPRPDPTRLPLESNNGKTRFEGKSECLFAKVNQMIQNYWKFCTSKNPDDLVAVDTGLKLIEDVIKKELQAYKVEGTVKDGFELVEK